MTTAQDSLLIQAFALVIKAKRRDLGISQEELAWRAGVDRTFVARLEVGRNQPSLSVLFALAEGLATPVEELIGETVRRLKIERRLARSAKAGQ
jgi:predicted transcriptional regulator